jgi:outer membrane protein
MKSSFRMAAAAALMAATAYTPALAQDIFTGPTGYQAGDIMTHLSVIGVVPENFGSHVGGLLAGDKVHASAGISPELDASYFFTPNLSVQLIAATTRHNVWVSGPGNKVKTGSTWVLPPTLTAQYHFAQIGAVRPYVGLGVTVAFFYGEGSSAFLQSNHLKNGGLSTAIGPSLEAGFDVPLTGNWTANVDVKQIFLVTGKHVGNGAVSALTELDPTVIGFGVGYKF